MLVYVLAYVYVRANVRACITEMCVCVCEPAKVAASLCFNKEPQHDN